MSLPRRAVQHPVTTTMVFAAMLVLGFISLNRLGQELFPEINLPAVFVLTVSPGVGPYEIEEGITRPIEGAVAGMSGVERITSISEESVSQVTISFAEGTDVDTAVHDIREQVSSVADEFPSGTQRSQLFKFNASILPSMQLHVYSRTEGIDIRGLVEDEVIPQLERVPGVGRVDVFGGQEAAVMVRLNLDSLSKRNIPISQVLQAFEGENVNLPAGIIDIEDRVLNLRTVGSFERVEDIGEVLVGAGNGVPIFLKDVAEIESDYRQQRQFLRTAEGEGLRLQVQKQAGFNTVEVNDGVLARLNELQHELPPSVRFEILEDQADSVRDAIGGVASAAWQGGLLAILVLLAFLRNLRSTFIIAAVIPAAVVVTFSLIDFGGLTINITTLLGMTLAIGMFVDNAIVVLESIYRKQLAGHNPLEAAIAGAEEVATAVTASTLTTMAVFLPMIFVSGLAGILFQPFSMTIAFSLFISLAASLTLTPMLCSRFLRVEAAVSSDRELEEISLADVHIHSTNPVLLKLSQLMQRLLQILDDRYEMAVRWSLRHPLQVIGSAIFLFLLSIGSVLLLGMEFIPEGDEGLFTVEFETRLGSSYQQTGDIAFQIEQIVREETGEALRTAANRVGSGGSNQGAVSVALVDAGERREDIWRIVNRIDQRIQDEVMDVRHTIHIEGMAALAAMADGETSPLIIELTGDDIDALGDYADTLVELLADTPGTRNIRTSHDVGVPEIQFRIKRQAAASLGLSPLEIAMTLRTAYNGTEVSRFTGDERDVDVFVILRDEDRTDLERITGLYFINRAGDRIPLESVVEVVEDEGPIAINRTDRSRVVRVLGSLSGELPLNRVLSRIDDRLDEHGDPPLGIERRVTGAGEDMAESFASLFNALLLAIMLVYMVMASQFESFVNPFIVMFSVPFAIIGLTAALLLTNTTFNLLSFVGAILLVGIVVNNAIVLIDYIDQLRNRGMELTEAIVHGGKTRLKPILMTSFTTLLGLVPMAIGTGGGAHLRAPIARAVIGGLATSSIITVILIPTLYFLVQGRLLKRRGTT
ncbi:efflux RND transporter permease subunit [Spirochaeta africana]|uniref:Cation/multidrug efflux pump n=1 Tax=Spirochaeta africana (strain ATCC 700263 / DSM 8902 / Z-7692) TaxID=889378 RepID=H9UFB3_SPIAZ|nr:efflux RND transporter permease subunit [Spirochaeta africana]AFG36206.1 cation/multidrug efflux pump [Spirochaeta africana DSM 8902]